jgi:hypothetical protein
MTSQKIRSVGVSRGLIGIWRSQGRQENGTPKGHETRNVTKRPAVRIIISGPQRFAPSNVYLRHTLTSPRRGAKCQNKSGSKHLQTAEK